MPYHRSQIKTRTLGDLPGHDFHGNQWTDEAFGTTPEVHATVRDAVQEMGDRQSDPREHHIGIDAVTGKRLFDVVGDAGGINGAMAKGLKNPTYDNLRPSAGVVPYGKVYDKQVVDIHTHPSTQGGAFSGED